MKKSALATIVIGMIIIIAVAIIVAYPFVALLLGLQNFSHQPPLITG